MFTKKKSPQTHFFQIFCGGFLLRKINRASFHLVLFLQKQKVCNGTTHKTIYNTTFIYRNVLLYWIKQLSKKYIRARVVVVAVAENKRHPALVVSNRVQRHLLTRHVKERFRSFKFTNAVETVEAQNPALAMLFRFSETLATSRRSNDTLILLTDATRRLSLIGWIPLEKKK